MAAATSPATPGASPATSGSNRGRRLSKVHRATEWLKPSFARSSATMSASVRDQMPKPSCVSCQLGSPTTTRFTRTRLSDIVHPVSSSQLTQDPDRVRSFGGYNSSPRIPLASGLVKNPPNFNAEDSPLTPPRLSMNADITGRQPRAKTGRRRHVDRHCRLLGRVCLDPAIYDPHQALARKRSQGATACSREEQMSRLSLFSVITVLGLALLPSS